MISLNKQKVSLVWFILQKYTQSDQWDQGGNNKNPASLSGKPVLASALDVGCFLTSAKLLGGMI